MGRLYRAQRLMAVQRSREQGIEVKGAELIFEPNNPTAVSIADAKKVQRLIDKLEEFDDVQNVLQHHGHHRRGSPLPSTRTRRVRISR